MMLSVRWKKLMSTMGMSDNRETFDALIDAYSDDSRKYHNLEHLRSVLTSLDLSNQLVVHKNELELALWFHDAVYQPLCSSNEYKSAEWARKFLTQNGVGEETIQLVVQLIDATGHSRKNEQNDEKLIADIDIAILGQSEDVYEKYAQDIRQEYQQVPALVFREKRKVLLQRFLNRSRIFATEYFFNSLEIQARRNIANEIQRL